MKLSTQVNRNDHAEYFHGSRADPYTMTILLEKLREARLNKKMIRVVLADDHPVVRKGIQAMLSLEPDMEIIGEAGDGPEALNIVARLRPDILVLDLSMKGLNGLEVTRRLTKDNPETHIIIHSIHNNECYVLDALKYGARAYILKENTDEDLIPAIREVNCGRRYLSRLLFERAIEAYTQKTGFKPADDFVQLSRREKEILLLVIQGLYSSQIAGRLLISPRTVEKHRANAMRKLGLHSQAELIRYAFREGFIAQETLS
jgi:DNA-binding NarL/FixJ family response regulator